MYSASLYISTWPHQGRNAASEKHSWQAWQHHWGDARRTPECQWCLNICWTSLLIFAWNLASRCILFFCSMANSCFYRPSKILSQGLGSRCIWTTSAAETILGLEWAIDAAKSGIWCATGAAKSSSPQWCCKFFLGWQSLVWHASTSTSTSAAKSSSPKSTSPAEPNVCGAWWLLFLAWSWQWHWHSTQHLQIQWCSHPIKIAEPLPLCGMSSDAQSLLHSVRWSVEWLVAAALRWSQLDNLH